MRIKKECQECHKLRNNLIKYHGDFLCSACRKRKMHIIGGTLPIFNLESSQKRYRKVTIIKQTNGNFRGLITVPQCYFGKLVRVVVDE